MKPLSSQRALVQEVVYRCGLVLGLAETLRPPWSAELGIRPVVKFYFSST